MAGTADLASILVPQTTGALRYGMGRIIAWDPQTFENIVEWSGIPIPNMLIANPTDALSYASDMLVSLIGIDSAGEEGVTQWVIWGRLVQPGGGAAELAVNFLRGALAREISADVFADRIRSAAVQPVCYRDAETFGDPSEGDPGPVVPDVSVSSTGTALVMISAQVYAHTGPTVTHYGGYMGVAVSGATTVDPGTSRSLSFALDLQPDEADLRSSGVMTRIVLLEGLNEGLHTFAAKYAKAPGSLFDRGAFDDRVITVIGL